MSKSTSSDQATIVPDQPDPDALLAQQVAALTPSGAQLDQDSSETFETLGQAIAAFPDLSISAKAARGSRKQLTRQETAFLINALQHGWTNERISRSLELSLSSVQLWRARLRPTVVEARAILESSALMSALEWRKSIPIAASKGDHKPAKDLLAAVGAIEQAHDIGVTIQLGMGYESPGNHTAAVDPFAGTTLSARPVGESR